MDGPPPDALLADARWLQGLIRQLVHDPEAAEDLCQDTLLAAWQGPQPAGRPWLARVARNLAVSLLRRDTLRRSKEGRVDPTPPTPATAELVAQAELQRAAVEAVTRLEEPYRSTLLMRFMQGMSLREVARASGVAVETVRTRQRRALATLRTQLAANFDLRQVAALPLFAIRPPTVSTTTLLGLLTMKTKLATALVLAAAATWGGFALADWDPAATDLPSPEAAAVTPVIAAQAPETRRVDAIHRATVPAQAQAAPDRDGGLEIQVHTPDGRPAVGAWVRARRARQPGSFKAGRTDARGRINIEEAQFLQRRGFTRFWAEGFGLKGPEVTVDPRLGDDQRITLQVPQGGSMRFVLQDQAGRPLHGTAATTKKLRLAVIGSETTLKNVELREVGCFAADGSLSVPLVAFGQHYRARVYGLFPRPHFGRGPTREQPHIEVPLRLSNDLVTFTGRAVDAEGEPLVGQDLGFHLIHPGGGSNFSCPLDGEGRFHILMPLVKRGVVFSLHATIGWPQRSYLVHWRDEVGPVVPGRNELGDCRFVPARLLLSGRLVVAGGRGVSKRLNPEMRLERWTDEGWQACERLRRHMQMDQQFEVRGLVPAGTRMRLTVTAQGAPAMAPIPFTVPTRDLEVPLVPGAMVQARFLVDDLELRKHCHALLLPEEPEDATPESQRIARRRSLQSAPWWQGPSTLLAGWAGIAPGRYRLRLLLNGAEQALVEIPGIVLAPGDNQDPRLRAIDLRRRLRRVEVRVADAAGAPLLQAEAHLVRVAKAGGLWHGQLLREGRAELLLLGPAEVRVFADGYRPARVADLFADREIRLQPLPSTRLRIRWPQPLPQGVRAFVYAHPSPGPHRPKAQIRGAGIGSTSDVLGCSAEIDSKGGAVLRPRVVGPHLLQLVLRKSGGGAIESFRWQPRKVELGTVRDGRNGELEITPDAEALRDSLKKLN